MQLSDARRLLDHVEWCFERHQAVQDGQFDFEVTPELLTLVKLHVDSILQALNSN